MNGKGSKRRHQSISGSDYANNYDRIFGAPSPETGRPCSGCDPSFGCWLRETEPCRKVPLVKRTFRAWCGRDVEHVELTNMTPMKIVDHMSDVVKALILKSSLWDEYLGWCDFGWYETTAVAGPPA